MGIPDEIPAEIKADSQIKSKVEISKYFTQDEVARHNTEGDIWVIHSRNVYDVTLFASDHPGGVELLLEYAGRDITDIMSNKEMHEHSKSALLMLEKYLIGRLQMPLDAGVAADADGLGGVTEGLREDVNFLNLKEPLIWQLLTKNDLTKTVYLEQVHIGRHLEVPAVLFHNPVLERLSHTPWWAIPTIWFPVVSILWSIASEVYPLQSMMMLYVIGLFAWTLIEYGFHRYIFHLDDRVPDKRVALTVHFLLHGIHHFLPMDRGRLVMPPVLFAFLSGSVFALFRFLQVPHKMLCGLYSGGLTGYIAYDLLHYYSHHGVPPLRALRWLKKYHMMHHYFYPKLGYGVSTPLWDVVFGTLIPMKVVQ